MKTLLLASILVLSINVFALEPTIPKNRALLGNRNAPVMIVMYSDFQCPYCSDGSKTLDSLKKKYGKKIAILYKHLPLHFHANAKIAAQYFEAVALQDSKKAYEFKKLVYAEKGKLAGEGEAFLKATAKKVNADMKKLEADINSSEVLGRIEEDMAEAKKFGITGTPGFIVAGEKISGALPQDVFEKIIDKNLKLAH